MNSKDKYAILQDLLDAHPSGAPASPSFDEILRLLFTEDEVDLAIHMNFQGHTAEQLSKKTSLPVDIVTKRLEIMADKVIIFTRDIKGNRVYGLVATVPGLFEFPFMKGGGTHMHDTLSVLWNRYKHEAQAEAFEGKPTPLMRVVPVNKSFDAKNEILVYDDVISLIDNSDYIALTECACRVSLKNCSKPTNVCMVMGYLGKFLVERGYAKNATKEEAHDALKRADEAGLVHCTNNSQEGTLVICNCCSCCCTVLRGRVEMDLKNSFAPSRYTVKIKADECIGCGVCIEDRCPNQAITMNDDNIAFVNEKKCIGCGLCVTGCPSNAITLIPGPEDIETPASAAEMALKVIQEKGKLDKMVEISV